MDRRDFFRILSATSAGALAGCGSKTDKLIPLLVPEHEIVPGEEQWHPSACAECAAGCGTVVRVMEAVRTVNRNGQTVRERIAAVKKIEGNPLDPVSGGRLCARGQAAVQSLYHPDRLQGPMKRTGQRGQAQFARISWDEALAMAAEKIGAADRASIALLTGPVAGSRAMALQRFTKSLGAPDPVICSIADHSVERKAAEMVFGWKGLPVYDLANASHAMSVGADFLGGWASPVFYGRQYGNFRQGRREIRGFLTHAESRLSTTAASADQWLPLLPGTEPQLLTAVGRILLEFNLARNSHHLPPGVLQIFQSADAAKLIARAGLSERQVRESVKALGESEAPLIIAGASILQSNSLDAIITSHYVNLMLGNVGNQGGILAPAEAALPLLENHRAAEALARAKVILLDDANPVYSLPRSAGVLESLSAAEAVISFGSFLDDSSAWADLVLPAHHPLESEAVVFPAVSSAGGGAIATPFVEALYETRAIESTLSGVAKKLDLDFESPAIKELVQPFLSGGDTLDDCARQGGVWPGHAQPREVRVLGSALELNAAAFDGDPSQYPLYFQPYLSLQFHDGRGANLPWLQELPDPASSSIWGLPVELDPQTAHGLGIVNGDAVRVQSPHGSIEAPAYVHPGAIPGVVSMAIGDGHTHYGRYASGRGANPLSILAPVWEKSTGQLVLGGTRVRIARAGGRKNWIQFSAPEREEIDFGHR